MHSTCLCCQNLVFLALRCAVSPDLRGWTSAPTCVAWQSSNGRCVACAGKPDTLCKKARPASARTATGAAECLVWLLLHCCFRLTAMHFRLAAPCAAVPDTRAAGVPARRSCFHRVLLPLVRTGRQQLRGEVHKPDAARAGRTRRSCGRAPLARACCELPAASSSCPKVELPLPGRHKELKVQKCKELNAFAPLR